MSAEARTWRYEAIGRDGARARAVIPAPDERSAYRRLQAEGLTVLKLSEVEIKHVSLSKRNLKPAERVLVIRQLSLMLEAGVGLLEALETVAAGIEAEKGREQFRAVVDALRQGSGLGPAMTEHAPGFPFYLYSMIGVGEAAGRIAEVLKDAADQMAYEEQLRRDFVNALTYPAFLFSAGVLAVLFIFTQVVPRFSTMIGDDRSNMPAISRLVLGVGTAAGENIVLVIAGLVALVVGGVVIASNPRARVWAYGVAHRTPVLGGVLKAREITAWARLTAFALANGVPLLQAARLSREAAPEGEFRRGLSGLETDLRAGVAIEASLAQHTRLTPMDLSLIRTGARTGALARMFGFLADSYDTKLRDQIKRFTSLMEPIAIGLISVIVGVVALSLVLALSSVYDQVV